VKAFFPGDEMASYGVAGTLSRALLWLVLPLAAVMFPKIVHASAKSEKSNLLGHRPARHGDSVHLRRGGPVPRRAAGGETRFQAGICRGNDEAPAVVCGRDDSAGAGERAGERFDGAGALQMVLPMVLLAIAYGFTLPFMLHTFPGRMEVALQTLGAFNLLLLGICAWFAWDKRSA
jgi:hypothetical protein